MWQKTQEARDGGRRSFLTGAVASLFGVSAVSLPAEADVSTDENKDVNELGEREKDRLAQQAMRDDRIKRIHRQLESRGLSPDTDSVVGYQTSYKDRTWKFVRIPFKTSGTESLELARDGDSVENGAIVWNTAAEIDPHGYAVKNTVDHDAEATEVKQELRKDGVDVDSMNTVPVRVELTKYGSDEQITSGGETNSVVFPVSREDRPTTDGCACSSVLANPLTACAPCGIPDTGCIADLAQAYALETAACGSCVGSSGWLTPLCLTCLATLVESDDLGFFCCPCEACDGIIVC